MTEKTSPETVFTFFVEGKPTGKGRHRVATRGDKAIQYTPKETEYAESEVLRHWEDAGRVKLDGPIKLVVNILHKRPNGHWKRDGLSKEGLRHPIPTTKPDLDNVVKLVMDALNEHGWNDDKQVVDVIMRRRWGKDGKQGIRVTAMEVDIENG